MANNTDRKTSALAGRGTLRPPTTAVDTVPVATPVGDGSAISSAWVAAHEIDTSTHGAADIADVSDIAVDANLSVAAQDAISKKHSQNTDTDLDATFEATFVKHTDVDDTPVDGVTADPISSNWAYDQEVKRAAMFSGLSKISVGLVEPSTPSTGDLWIDTN